MSDTSPSSLYDAYYYASGCGRPYQRDAGWLNFFGAIADHIVNDIQPGSVLDAGCAWGFLVENLRQREVEAFGVDISEYAISNVHPSIRPYCWVGSIADPFPRRYDLIVSIEVLEHMPRAEAEKAVENFCRFTDDVLFSSTPFDYKEVTHFNVQPPEYWAELFARQGFFRDVDFDASFLTPWAVRFRRRNEPVPRLVREYERRFFLLTKENADLRSLTVELRNEAVQSFKEELEERDRKIDQLRSQLADANGQLHAVLNSASWRFMQKFQRVRLKFIPVGSRREEAARQAMLFLRHPFRRGLQASGKFMNPEGTGSLAPPSETEYAAWIADHEPTEAGLAGQRRAAQALAYRPLISITTPVYNPPAHVLRATIESVLAQTYDNWEICLADGGSTAPGVKAVLDEYSQRDPRVRVRYLEKNEGISGNSNAAIGMAQGEFVALFDHDDTLSPGALYAVAKRLNEKPETDLLYFDEDKLSEDGRVRRDPFFKPDWSPAMLLSANYLTHPVVRRSLVEEVGLFDPAFDGTQDWDLMLRLSERTSRVEHIPQVLYHWRQVSGSTAAEFNAKPWVFERQLLCVTRHLERQGLAGVQASFPRPGSLHATWKTGQPKVSIVIPTKEKVDFLQRCLESIFEKTAYQNIEVVLVDNGSRHPKTLKFYEKLRQDGRVRFVDYRADQFNFSAALNLGAQAATGDIFLFLNNDTQALDPGWLEEMVRWAERPETGVVGAKLLYPDGTIQHAGVVVGLEGHASHVFWGAPEGFNSIFGSVEWYRNFSAVTGACMMMRREIYEKCGGFSEEYILTFSDIEICLRVAKMGYHNVYTPFSRLIHFEGRSRASHIPVNDIFIGAEHMGAQIEAGDPYYNPNLSYAVRLPALSSRVEETRSGRLKRIIELARRSMENSA